VQTCHGLSITTTHTCRRQICRPETLIGLSSRAQRSHLIGNLAGDLVSPHRVIGGRLLEAKIGSHKDERHGDAEPQEAEGKQCPEGHSPAGLLAPDKHVQHEENHKHNAGEKQRSLDGCRLPLLALWIETRSGRTRR
jgi:hypothetical protein